MSQEQPYDVHVFVPIRFKVRVLARDKTQAMTRAKDLLMKGDGIARNLGRISCLCWPVQAVDWDEDEPVTYLVDPPEGTDHSTWHGPDFEQIEPYRGTTHDN